jgi:menaquinone-dependent protoporphyrinogen IX oxidase
MMDGADKDKEEAAVEKQIKVVLPDLRAHKQFRGRFVLSEMNWFMRMMVYCVSEDKFPRGDKRDWADIEAWGDEVAKEMKHLVVHTEG